MTKTDVQSPRNPLSAWIFPSGAGVLVGFNLTLRVSALGVLVFYGPFIGGLHTGVSILLLMTACVTLALFIQSDVPPIALGSAQDAPIAILMPAIFMLGTTMSATSGVATVFAILGATTVIAGVMMLLLSWFDLARIVRLLPFPVVAGYLASTGALLALSSFQFAGRTPDLSPDNSGLISLFLALGFSALMAALAKWRKDIGPLLATGLALIGFFGWAQMSGISIPELRAAGFLPQHITDGAHQSPGFALATHVEWQALFQFWPTMFAAAAIAALGAILNVTGVELVARADMSHKKALANTGWINLLFGLLGSGPGYLSASNTSVAKDLGGNTRVVSVVACLFVLGGLWFAPRLLPSVPVFLSAGVLIYIGWTVLSRWFFSQRSFVSTLDWMLIGLIVAIALIFGMLEALAAGVMIASLMFAVTYGKLPVVRRVTTLATQRSTVDRGPAETELLDQRGNEVVLVDLQGFLFFGSVERLVQTFRSVLTDSPHVRTIILDFKAVSGFDSASIEALRKLEFLAETNGKTVILAGLGPSQARSLDRGGILTKGGVLSLCGDADTALERAEIAILDTEPTRETTKGAFAALYAVGVSAEAVGSLRTKMTKRWLANGERLIRAGDEAGDIYLIESGRLAILAPLQDGTKLRVRSLRAGAFVGEIASYAGLKRTADVMAEEPSVVYAISPGDIEALTQTDPELAAIWHKMIATTLADKIDRTNRLLRDRP